MKQTFDVVIAGGGLAGLTLARQLFLKNRSLSIAVLEKSSFPCDEAAHKVGESSVELAAHYFGEVLELKDYIDQNHLHKAGLRFFFPAGDNSDITKRSEFGVTLLPPLPSYQLDRGSFENHLWNLNKECGITCIDNAQVSDVLLSSEEMHTTTYTIKDKSYTVDSTWFIDATSRRALLKKKLGLSTPAVHKASSVWFRVKGIISPEQFSRRQAWNNRVKYGLRRLSTNHLMGKGYWVWLIPLKGGYTSIGIVFHEDLHDAQQFLSFEKSLNWLKEHEPQCAELIMDKSEEILDFKVLRKYSTNCTKLFSEHRWAITGEAGLFADPFYSPGSDFIAMSNSFITELILSDFKHKPISELSHSFEKFYIETYDSFMNIYKDSYPMFGNGPLISFKIAWDWAVYWGLYSLLFFNDALTNHSFIEKNSNRIDSIREVNDRMQKLLVQINLTCSFEVEKAFVSFKDIAFLKNFIFDLAQSFDLDQLENRLQRNYELLETMGTLFVEEITDTYQTSNIFDETYCSSYNKQEMINDIHLLTMNVFNRKNIQVFTSQDDSSDRFNREIMLFTHQQLKRYEKEGDLPSYRR